MAAHKRRVLRVESHITVLQKEAQITQSAIEEERNKLSAAVAELKRFELAWWDIFFLNAWMYKAIFYCHVQASEFSCILQSNAVNWRRFE